MIMIIRIKNLRLRTVVGIQNWERKQPQDVIINVEMEFDGTKAAESDSIDDTINYKVIKGEIIKEVENARCYLLDRLASQILKVIMENKKVKRAKVEVDKPQALRFADSVSVVCSSERP
jgi:D-erythro-7,8-dihydroneopterin triphosphate epimerase